jgi:hypothetical protein
LSIRFLIIGCWGDVDKDRELGEANAEIKALRLSERQREKAVEELTEELTKLDEKLKLTESILESKVLFDNLSLVR